MTAEQLAMLRERFRPLRTRLLFVGESPPVGGTFFYLGDSNLARHTCEAFEAAGVSTSSGTSSAAFPDHFMSAECFLVDLCAQPVNGLTPRDRRRARRDGETALADALRDLRPSAIIVVMKAIESNVRRAIRQVNLGNVPTHYLPFPAMGHQCAYVRQLTDILERLQREGLIAMPKSATAASSNR